MSGSCGPPIQPAMARHDRMAAAGTIPLPFPPRQIRREPAKVAQMSRDPLNRGHMRPRLPTRTFRYES